MIKNVFITGLLIGVIGLSTQCRQAKISESGNNTTTGETQVADTALHAVLESNSNTTNLQDSLMIRFTVINPTKGPRRFTVYHTPFEGTISKFLTVTDSTGKEVDYFGPMVKRVMPPPENTYHTLAAGQSESVVFDLKKCYKIAHTGVYTLQYNGENISGIANGKPMTITIAK